MSEQVKKLSLKELFTTIFSTDEYIEENLPKELKEITDKVDKMAETSNIPINCEKNKSSKNGGFSKEISTKGINPKTLDAMRTKVEQSRENER